MYGQHPAFTIAPTFKLSQRAGLAFRTLSRLFVEKIVLSTWLNTFHKMICLLEAELASSSLDRCHRLLS